MDYTIEVWSTGEDHFAQCSCGKWYFTSKDTVVLETYIKQHSAKHRASGDYVEVV